MVVIRFGHDENEQCMQMDEVLYKISEDVRNFAVFYLVDITEVGITEAGGMVDGVAGGVVGGVGGFVRSLGWRIEMLSVGVVPRCVGSRELTTHTTNTRMDDRRCRTLT